MKTCARWFLLLVLCTPQLMAESTPPADALIAAMKKSNLLNSPAKPFQMDVDFVVVTTVPVMGHLQLNWAEKSRWRIDLTMMDYQLTQIRDGEREYRLRNSSFTPLRVQQLVGLLGFAADGEALEVKKVKHRNEQGLALTCFEVERQERKGITEEICLQDSTGSIVSMSHKLPLNTVAKTLLSDYADFEGYSYPRTLMIAENDRAVVKAKVAELKSVTFDEILLKPPTGALERRRCENEKPPKPIKMPNPEFPPGDRGKGVNVNVVMAITVGSDGSVSDVVPMSEQEGRLNDAAMAAVRRWKFEPAMCGNEPVVTDINVQVNFWTY